MIIGVLPQSEIMSKFLTAAFYQFHPFESYAQHLEPLENIASAGDVKGTILLAEEGINGTISGPEEGVRAVLEALRSLPGFSELEHKESWADHQPFYRLKVRLKNEIVTLRQPGIDPRTHVGEYVEPEDWNALIEDPDVVVVDCRNDYEVQIGTFKNAINPKTQTFTEFPDWAAQQESLKDKPRVAMFCTGGIRCEKSTAYMKSQGFDQVYHLKGGILKYLEVMPREESLWQGECFVFDERVSVGHGLAPGDYTLCRACRFPLSQQERDHDSYEEGVSCPYCHGTHSVEKLASLRERQKQVELARARGQRHVGAEQKSSTPS